MAPPVEAGHLLVHCPIVLDIRRRERQHARWRLFGLLPLGDFPHQLVELIVVPAVGKDAEHVAVALGVLPPKPLQMLSSSCLRDCQDPSVCCRKLSGSLGHAAGSGRNPNPDTGTAQHCDQGIDAEAIDLPPDKITDSRLADSHQLCCLDLGPAFVLDPDPKRWQPILEPGGWGM